ncbi:OmpA family protein [Leucothrix sargassi]|nr:OmpA family protein [Leucothrix sargassi]
MRKLLIILLAIVCWAIIGWLAAYKVKAPAIEADIQTRVNEALASNNLSWAEATVDGRDVTVAGLAQSEQLSQHALRTANVEGVNSIRDEMMLQDTSTVTANPAVEEKVEVTEPLVASAPAYPYSMTIGRDADGQYTFSGVVPDTDYKREIDAHLRKIDADPESAVWNVNVSSATAPVSWEQHAKDSISALHSLKSGSASLTEGKAVIQGVAASEEDSQQAEAFAQLLAVDYTTDLKLTVAEQSATVEPDAPPVGSSKYAALRCQTEFNGLLKKESIQFESGSSTLQDSSKALLEMIAQVTGRCPSQSININGYTDSNGSAKTNKELSQLRAEAVANYLVTLGVNPARLSAEGYGEAKPIASNKTEAGRAKNRRIELIVKGSK